ncbi:MAG: hypothetical protein I8H71_00990 [Xanthomonadaceae bacterium]|nr:hypothetical protein [Xanthomonadaceae bacterium]
MLGNWVKQTTATAGAGDLALAPVAGHPTAHAVFGSRRFFYTALTEADLPLEAGEGYLSSAAILVRDRVLNTYDGSSFSAGGSPLALPVGVKQVICAPIAQSVISPAASVDTSAFFGGSAYTKLPANFLAESDFPSITLAANQNYLVPIFKEVADPISQIGLRVATAAAGKLIAVGIFDRDAAGFAGRTLAAVAGLSVGATGEVLASLSETLHLPAGWYWAGFVTDGTPSIGAATLVQHAGGSIMSNRRIRYWGRTNTYAAYGATANSNSTGSLGAVNNLPAPMLLYR